MGFIFAQYCIFNFVQFVFSSACVTLVLFEVSNFAVCSETFAKRL